MKIKINNIYTVGCGFYLGEKFLLTWINPTQNICIAGKRYTSVYGQLIYNGKHISTILEFLMNKDFINYKKISKVQLITRIKKGDLKAKKEFIVRYKKVPKF